MAKNRQVNLPSDAEVGSAITATSEKFKDSFIGTLKESNTAREELKSVMKDLLLSEEPKKIIADIVRNADRSYVHSFISRVGFALWSIISMALGSILLLIFQHFTGLR
jgi:hypothetical protein